MKSYDVIINHKGNIDLAVIDSILLRLKNYIQDKQLDIVTRKRLYTLAVECLDNIYKHADNLEFHQDMFVEFPPRFIIEKIGEDYMIHTGNVIFEKNKEKITNKINKINSHDQNEINKLYKRALMHAEISDKGGAGLGLIVMARSTGQKIKYDFEKINDKFFYFAMQLTLKK
ncbi:MAG: hypothetical protein A2W99_04890 [Bacteroidetes bacterium GWF2_33_16]|nr:MAG: hypothetical protein A2X00_17410 [Bacteroidetes bacterium GWE2_32_14]OFY06003.1 MAG: hypothetical protein A2W99_04890 [Bacteroidetes bacterium GWF2_33_16]